MYKEIVRELKIIMSVMMFTYLYWLLFVCVYVGWGLVFLINYNGAYFAF